MTSQVAGYIGKQFENGFVGYLTEANFFATLSLEEGVTADEGKKFLDDFKQALLQASINNLSEFESGLSGIIVKLNFPAHFSLAAGYINQNVLYVKTVGKGQIYYRRGNEFDLLMDGDKSASGYVQEYDCAIFTTLNSREQIGEETDMKAFIDMSPPHDIVEKLKNEKYEEHGTGFVALFVEFTSQAEAEVSPPSTTLDPSIATGTPTQAVSTPQAPTVPISVSPVAPTQPPSVQPQSSNLTVPQVQFFKSKKLTIVAVIAIFVILVWSVVFGYQRRIAAQLQKQIETSQQKIGELLQKSRDEAFINVDQAVVYLDQAKNELASLKKQIGTTHEQDIVELEKKIQETEGAIIKREEKTFEEFYDLALEDKGTQGITAYLDENQLAILDTKNSMVYVLSLDKKAITSYAASEVKNGSLVALYDNQVFFFSPKNGVYKFASESKADQVIKADSDWGSIVDMEVYNGNIYLLDSKNDEVYKYLVAESGYSNKTSYFQSGQSVDLDSAVDMSIDSAIYIAQKNDVLKYLNGQKDPFDTKYPDRTPNIDGIYTNADLEQVFVWDTGVGILYVVEKDGKYNRQLASSIIRKAKKILIYDKQALVFDGAKLYSIALN
ncbi:hypothetical protein A3A93_01770 [Candidatus Roizmanbacteria bacterium RIFCSPLOWO2_01_FULL_38_12]|uniref:Uncharacterized protein n=1 Tax=Candidatus Roizmanbacteria bacterium RIFCSPLOWO2_01_FULL_38_12 TaxID=1802061 RepID=A0A1F7IYE8_9BACT|nr:MAG: hypothetical protein A2861_02225 [Candidatus Roizmanbacteria bacterium RIFCSPHIGHO2_01_FULL_38_15]OGK34516.1 MAG: hypothetical protein A3F59_04300 [Candidatus Roizmanbacteria bacterium RIFCSPHIGHO2_12_FULL_38_13]OGK48345.1 MAG: hypothetical protein A3A93_01770 [Candidatus Roizmanbacteria bacterium RIFCSPLOWO2_01_FULL_38_12]